MNDQEEAALEPEQTDSDDLRHAVEPEQPVSDGLRRAATEPVQPVNDRPRRGFILNERVSKNDFDLLHSFTRLILGGALEGWDQLTTRLQAWEEEARSLQASQPDEPSLIIINNDPERPVTGPAQPVESQAKVVRLAITGLLFKGQARMVRRRARALSAANQTTTAALKPLANWAGKQKRFRPAKNRFDALVQRGEMVSREWIDRGRLEDARSRLLVRTAAKKSFGDTMDELGQAPALQDLVRKQSAGLTQDALDEARVRTVSGDYVLEQFLRSILRRIPRSQLPPPPTASDGPDLNNNQRD
jgi:hypothetical protein